MVFNFTFSFGVPGIVNPFLAQAETTDTSTQPNAATSAPVLEKLSRSQVGPRSRLDHTSLPPSAPLSKKRGWAPSNSEPIQPVSVNASSSGYLDTPAKYRDMVQGGVGYAGREQSAEVEETDQDIHPSKRRRTFTGAVISTAVSAAVIGTAVGLTVYRLWSNRGREPEPAQLPPPPPYTQGDWIHPEEDDFGPSSPKSHTPPTTTARRRPRHTVIPASSRKAATMRHPRRSVAPRHHISPRSRSPDKNSTGVGMSSVQTEFNFGQTRGMVGQEGGEEEEVEDKMDWMGDRLAMLIAEGQKALGKEVVVMSDAAEDEVDDGSGAWVDQGPSGSGSGSSSMGRSRSRSGSVRRRGRAPAPHALTPSWTGAGTGALSVPSSSSPRAAAFGEQSMQNVGLPMSLPNQGAWGSHSDAGIPSSYNAGEDSSMLESTELKATMERARAAYLARRAGGSSS
ncbi:uncharacterized protein STEHIDRAFT_121455 [Stereum hirsutum FP-91666 SS1]|uniref:uncharacterized protein n=1 Tax=Stereum hirsutum (strain FP-91666) TaxID=721885 RepID=UPI000440C823|nr:uncharacterized protein STEHIDRAFT_121455 [Stereum hirsutum FP-91666 SS1]EIM86533.1 hypothetical protein STEHIDRAFT_121455 [Stereum hirsutum FP-91666 SS1]